MAAERRPPAKTTNSVAEACAKFPRGVQEAAAVAGVRVATMYDWKAKGYITLLGPALDLAEATGIPVERFRQPKNLRAARRRT